MQDPVLPAAEAVAQNVADARGGGLQTGDLLVEFAATTVVLLELERLLVCASRTKGLQDPVLLGCR